MNEKKNTRPPLESLACVNPDCDLYGQKGNDNLTIRKVYGRDQIRYLRCRVCQDEFSERKNTALWNSKIPEAKAISVAEHLAEGCSLKGTARLVKVDPSTVRRLNGKVGRHGQQYHEQEVQDVVVTELQADERHGFAGNKQQPMSRLSSTKAVIAWTNWKFGMLMAAKNGLSKLWNGWGIKSPTPRPLSAAMAPPG
jgi:transposase-like protein